MNTWQALSSAAPGSIFAFFLVFGAIALYRRWIVFGWQYDEIKTDRDGLKQDLRESDTTKRDLTNSLNNLTDSLNRFIESDRQRGSGS